MKIRKFIRGLGVGVAIAAFPQFVAMGSAVGIGACIALAGVCIAHEFIIGGDE